jgi:hypothetical protein
LWQIELLATVTDNLGDATAYPAEQMFGLLILEVLQDWPRLLEDSSEARGMSFRVMVAIGLGIPATSRDILTVTQELNEADSQVGATTSKA